MKLRLIPVIASSPSTPTAGIVLRLPNCTLKVTLSPLAYSISTPHGAALSGRASMMLRENTVPAPTFLDPAACG